MMRYLFSIPCTVAPAIFALIWTSPVLGQEELEEVVVTGSYLPRPADRPQPVQVLTAEDIVLEQRLSVAEVLKDLSVMNGTVVLNNFTESGQSPTTTVNLRGLGARATLPLINGRRQTIDATNGTRDVSAVDINNLAPSIMLGRIEVLTDGASALYGSDAVAGVVNFITRKDFEGFELSLQGLSVDRPSTKDFRIAAIAGSQSETTSIVGAFEYAERERIDAEDVYDTNRILELVNGSPTILLSSSGNPGSFRETGGRGAPPRFPDPLCGDPSLGAFPTAGIPQAGRGGPSCGLPLSLGRNIVAEVERLSGMVTVDHDLGGSLSAEMEVGFARVRNNRHLGFNFPVSRTGQEPVVPVTNPGLIEENLRSGLPLVPYRIYQRLGSPVMGDAGPALNFQDQDTWRVVGALGGDFNADWSWEVSASFSQNDSRLEDKDTLRDRLQLALDCMGLPTRNTCYNPFANNFLASPGDPEFNDPALREWMTGDRLGTGHAELTTIEFLVTGSFGELGGEPIGFAVGAQHRDQEFLFGWDPVSQDGGFGFNNVPLFDFGGTRKVDAVFAELVLFPNDELEIQLAGRYEDYGDGVDSFDPKIGVLWTPTDRLFLRASAGTSFKIPGEVQTFGNTATGCGGCQLNGVDVEARGARVGTPNLKPEEGESFTAGITWDVTDNFSMEFNYYYIEFTDLVRAEDGSITLDADVADNGIIDDPRFIIDPAAGTRVAALLVADDIIGIELGYLNQDFQETDGVDFRFDWNIPSGANEFGLSLQGTKTLTFDLADEGVTFDAVGSWNSRNFAVPTPDWSATLRFDWRRGGHFARATVRHIPAIIEDNPTREPATEEISYSRVDLLYNYRFGTDNLMTLSVGVVNATDEEDPISGAGLTTNNTLLYDPRGRMVNVGFTVGF